MIYETLKGEPKSPFCTPLSSRCPQLNHSASSSACQTLGESKESVGCCSARQGLYLETDAQASEDGDEAAVLEADDNRSDGGDEESLEGDDDDSDEVEDNGDQSTDGDAEENGEGKVSQCEGVKRR